MSEDFDPRRVKAARIRAVLLEMTAARPDRGVAPDEVARAIAGPNEKVWRLMMKPIRAEALRLARDGVVVLMRKGRPADPDRLRGLYRIRLRGEGEALPVFEAEPEDDDLDLDFDDEA